MNFPTIHVIGNILIKFPNYLLEAEVHCLDSTALSLVFHFNSVSHPPHICSGKGLPHLPKSLKSSDWWTQYEEEPETALAAKTTSSTCKEMPRQMTTAFIILGTCQRGEDGQVEQLPRGQSLCHLFSYVGRGQVVLWGDRTMASIASWSNALTIGQCFFCVPDMCIPIDVYSY